MKIGHISDIHWLDLEGVRIRDFLNKRLSGAVNLVAGRAKKHTHGAVVCALEALRAQGCEHLIVTGDLTNLALEAEFRGVKAVLNRYFDDGHLTVVPGNHDFYTRESANHERFQRFVYGGRAPGNLAYGAHGLWPFVQLVGDEVAVIGLNSAQPRPWFVAAGRLSDEQLSDLSRALELPEVRARFVIVALHHHFFRVVRAPGERLRHLDDRKKALEICLNGGVGLIVHGHNHDFTQMRVGNLLISEAGSCSVGYFKDDNRAGKFNIYDIGDGALQNVETWRYEGDGYRLWRNVKPSEFMRADAGGL